MSSEKTDHALSLLKQGADWLGLDLTPAQLSQFATFAAELIAWNKKFNLTAVTDIEKIQTTHFLDSLACFLGFPGVGGLELPRPLSGLSLLGSEAVLDVGAGAGFPGIPLAIAHPAISLALLESVRKKTTFLDHVVAVLGLGGVNVLTGRAEDFGHTSDHRERYDVVLSRAVADLAVLVEYCLPFLKVGGRFIAPKKGDVQGEIDSADRAIAVLGGSLAEVRAVEVPQLLGPRLLVLIDKVEPSPSEFPRRAGVPAKRPLGRNPS